MTTTNVADGAVVIPAHCIAALRQQAAWDTAHAADDLQIALDNYPSSDLLAIDRAKGRLDRHHALFDFLTDVLTDQDCQVPGSHLWAAVIAAENIVERLADRIGGRDFSNEGMRDALAVLQFMLELSDTEVELEASA